VSRFQDDGDLRIGPLEIIDEGKHLVARRLDRQIDEVILIAVRLDAVGPRQQLAQLQRRR